MSPPIFARHSRESGNPEGGEHSWDARGGMSLVRSRIYGIIGLSGFPPARVFDRQALVRICLGGIFCYGEKREPGETKS